MSTALFDLSQVAFGIETTAGTIVAADTALVVDEGVGGYKDIQEHQVRPAPRQVLAEVEDALVRKESQLSYTQDLTYEELPLVGLCGLANVAGSNSNANYTYTFTPGLTAPKSLLSASFELFVDDGSTKHYKTKFGYATVSHFVINIQYGQPAKLSVDWFGRAAQSLALPAAPSVLSGREIVISDLFSLYIDAGWASLGTTQKSGLVRSAKLDVSTGFMPDYTLDGRSDLDFTQLRAGQITGTFEITAEFNADAETERAAYAAETLRFISLEVAGSSGRQIKLQACVKYLETPAISEQDGLVVVTLVGRLRYDATSGDVLNIVATNKIASY